MAKAPVKHEHEPEPEERVTKAVTPEQTDTSPDHLEPYPTGDPWLTDSELFYQAHGFYRETGTTTPPEPEAETAKAKKGK